MASPTSAGIVSAITGGSGDLTKLFADSKWGGAVMGAPVTLTYSFRVDGDLSTYSTSEDSGYGPSDGNGEPWLDWFPFGADQKATIQAALAEWSKVANITFEEVADSETEAGDLRFGFTDGYAAFVDAPAWAYNPEATAYAGDVWFDNYFFEELGDATPGSYGYMVAVHEIGHALGLKHPHDFPPLASGRDYIGNTLMSYRDYPSGPTGGGFESDVFTQGPMYLDIAAIQYLYGANTDDTTDTSYSWDIGEPIYDTIWDAGGAHDLITWAGHADRATIDLRPNHWSLIGPERFDGHPSPALDEGYTRRNLNIAAGVTIENATGGNAGDQLIGNGAANTLIGNLGADTLQGGNGADTLRGSGGNDRLEGGAGADRVFGGLGSDKLTGGADADRFVFDSVLNASTNKDRIFDFDRTQGDRIELDNDIFVKLGASDTTRTLNADHFALGSAHDSNDYIIYKASTGELFYDPNGNGAGGASLFAVLTRSDGTHPGLFNWCFQIVG